MCLCVCVCVCMCRGGGVAHLDVPRPEVPVKCCVCVKECVRRRRGQRVSYSCLHCSRKASLLRC